MDSGTIALAVILIIFVIFVIVVIARSVKIVSQATSLVIERLGGFHTVFSAGFHLLIPFIDRVRAGVDLREQVVSFPPQPVITSDNLVVSIDTVIYFQVIDAKSATYEIANYIIGIEQLTVTTLRNVIGSLDLEGTLTSRDQINSQLRGVLDDATGRWGIRVNRVELKAIDPPASVQDSMEKQMRAERDRRAAILTAEGYKQSQILNAEGEKQSQVLRAEGGAQAAVLEAEGEARAIQTVFEAIHEGDPDSKLLAYQYLHMLPELAKGDSNTLWVIPTELTAALKGIGGAFGGSADGDGGAMFPPMPGGPGSRDGASDDAPTGEPRKKKPRNTRPSLPTVADASLEGLGTRPAANPSAEAESMLKESKPWERPNVQEGSSHLEDPKIPEPNIPEPSIEPDPGVHLDEDGNEDDGDAPKN